MFNRNIIVFAALLLLAACTSLTTTHAVHVSADESWALLPINNLSTTPRAGQKTRAMVETQLRRRGVQTLESYTVPEGLNLVSLLDTEQTIAEAIAWGRANGYRYGVTGTIHEWHYKSGPDKEPAVGLSLKLIDLESNEVLWQGTSAKTGWGYTNLSGIADKTIQQLLDQIYVDGPY